MLCSSVPWLSAEYISALKPENITIIEAHKHLDLLLYTVSATINTLASELTPEKMRLPQANVIIFVLKSNTSSTSNKTLSTVHALWDFIYHKVTTG